MSVNSDKVEELKQLVTELSEMVVKQQETQNAIMKGIDVINNKIKEMTEANPKPKLAPAPVLKPKLQPMPPPKITVPPVYNPPAHMGSPKHNNNPKVLPQIPQQIPQAVEVNPVSPTALSLPSVEQVFEQVFEASPVLCARIVTPVNSDSGNLLRTLTDRETKKKPMEKSSRKPMIHEIMEEALNNFNKTAEEPLLASTLKTYTSAITTLIMDIWADKEMDDITPLELLNEYPEEVEKYKDGRGPASFFAIQKICDNKRACDIYKEIAREKKEAEKKKTNKR